jgi:hypothetical protein
MKNLRVLSEDTTLEKIRANEAMLPTDTHLVRYAKDGAEKVAAIRAFKYVDIFDELYDQGYQVLEITRGFGRIKPKLYNASIHEASL